MTPFILKKKIITIAVYGKDFAQETVWILRAVGGARSPSSYDQETFNKKYMVTRVDIRSTQRISLAQPRNASDDVMLFSSLKDLVDRESAISDALVVSAHE